MGRPVFSIPTRRLVLVLVLLVGLFSLTLSFREPWRGHLAPGDHWVTGQTLRFLSTWREEGAWASRLALVLTPPNAVEKPQKKWGLPGHHLLVHGVLWAVGAAPDVEALMRLNLATHLILVLLLATLAYAISRNGWIGEPRAAPIAAFHCGAFALLLPAMFYWGQNLSVQYLTVLPLFVFCVAGRWLRAAATSPGARRAIDAGVAVCVFWGVTTDFLFWLVVPYLVGMQLLRSWRGRPRPEDPWVWTLVVPYLAAFLALLLLFWANQQLGTVEDRFGRWVIGAEVQERLGLGRTLARKPLYFSVFLSKHYWDAYVLVGLLCLALAVSKLPRRSTRGLSPDGAGLLVDLSLPCVLFVLTIGRHQVIHATSAMKFLPFVALTWTGLVPALLPSGHWRGRVALAGYAVLAFLILCPFTNGHQRYFPEPSVAFEAEARRIRESTRPSDVVVSEEMEITLYPPQRIALSERRVGHVYGPLDLFLGVQGREDAPRLALYRAPRLAALLGAAPDPDGSGDDGLRFLTHADLFAFLDTQPYGSFLRDMGHIPNDFPPSDPVLRPYAERLGSIAPPVGIHAIPFSMKTGKGSRLHWRDPRHLHRVSRRGETVTIDETTWSRGRIWREGPFAGARDVAWANDLLSSVERLRHETAPPSFTWRGHTVLPLGGQSVRPGGDPWDSFLLVRDGTPFGTVLAPAAQDGQREPARIVALLEPFEGAITRPSPIEPQQWSIEKRPELGYRMRATPWTEADR